LVSVLVEERTVGTANGIATSMQMLGIGLCNVAVGIIKDQYGYSDVMWFFAGMGALATLFAILLNFADTDGVLREGEVDRVKEEEEESTGYAGATSLLGSSRRDAGAGRASGAGQ
jgi:nitrate/nitrite transporter NarK